MILYTMGIAWNWEYDADFVNLLESALTSRGLSLLQITPDNFEDMMCSLSRNELAFRVFFDRASDSDPCFEPLIKWAGNHATYCINHHEKARRTWDKTAMHQTLIHAGLYTPYGIILPSYAEQPELSHIDLNPLGKRFTIKPAHGGGGEGVVNDATSLKEVLDARKLFPADKYLLQSHIDPIRLGNHMAWFRVIYCSGQIYPCWWDNSTHIYTLLTCEDKNLYNLTPLIDMTATVARLSSLDIFSTEIAITVDGTFVVIDFVNDQIDLRLKSKACDGVPDTIVQDIAARAALLAATNSGDPSVYQNM